METLPVDVVRLLVSVLDNGNATSSLSSLQPRRRLELTRRIRGISWNDTVEARLDIAEGNGLVSSMSSSRNCNGLVSVLCSDQDRTGVHRLVGVGVTFTYLEGNIRFHVDTLS